MNALGPEWENRIEGSDSLERWTNSEKTVAIRHKPFRPATDFEALVSPEYFIVPDHRDLSKERWFLSLDEALEEADRVAEKWGDGWAE